MTERVGGCALARTVLSNGTARAIKHESFGLSVPTARPVLPTARPMPPVSGNLVENKRQTYANCYKVKDLYFDKFKTKRVKAFIKAHKQIAGEAHSYTVTRQINKLDDTLHPPPAGRRSPPRLFRRTIFRVVSRFRPFLRGFQISRMTTTAAALYQSFNSNWLVRDGCHSHSCRIFQEFPIGSPSVGVRSDNKGYVGKNNSFSLSRLPVLHSPKYQAARLHLAFSSIESHSYSSQTAENESVLILMRHGESMWNEKNLFTGCVDVPLTSKGVEEAVEAGKRISNLPLDIIYTSALIRAQMTTMLALTEHHCMKVPIIMHHDETEQARTWSQIYSEDTKKQSIPVIKAWQLNERMYGELQGFNKQETAELYGKEQVYNWRRSYHVRPPNGESLEMCLGRAVAFFKEHIEPQLLRGRHVMVVAHANSLRSIIMYLDKLTSEEVINLELSTGVPMLYTYKEGNFIRRGSPHGSSEAGVYAYTESLADYRQKLVETNTQ
ncbi:Phosphoglycerate mutase family protein [Perilla frutescens var. hirtella]|nr:Phosphoglycerate mutase family protein [Perilla frutescens var. hirtella]